MNNLEALIECYLDICQYEKKLSQDTLKAYRTDLAQFRAFAVSYTHLTLPTT